MLSTILNPLAILVSLSTATGVLIHDTHIDQAASAMTMPALMANVDTTKSPHLNGADHTHVERASATQTLIHLNGHMPKIQPRNGEDKKHLMQKRVMRGHHTFDSYNLPVLS